ncbi:hypothetical protein Peur_009456 [Populus x canadensis]
MRLGEWRLKRRETKEWMRHLQLPYSLRELVGRFVQYKWLATSGLMRNQSCVHTYVQIFVETSSVTYAWSLLDEFLFFSQMDDKLLDTICGRLVEKLESSTPNGGRTGFFMSITLRPGDFCGEELLAWALLPKSTLNLPSSTRTGRALEEVEAFALRAEDLNWAACFIQAAWRRHKKRMMAKSVSMSESFSVSVDEQTD